MPVVWASRLLGTPLKERVPAPTAPKLCEIAAERPLKVFLPRRRLAWSARDRAEANWSGRIRACGCRGPARLLPRSASSGTRNRRGHRGGQSGTVDADPLSDADLEMFVCLGSSEPPPEVWTTSTWPISTTGRVPRRRRPPDHPRTPASNPLCSQPRPTAQRKLRVDPSTRRPGQWLVQVCPTREPRRLSGCYTKDLYFSCWWRASSRVGAHRTQRGQAGFVKSRGSATFDPGHTDSSEMQSGSAPRVARTAVHRAGVAHQHARQDSTPTGSQRCC